MCPGSCTGQDSPLSGSGEEGRRTSSFQSLFLACEAETHVLTHSATSWTVAHQGPLSISQQNPGASCHFLLQGGEAENFRLNRLWKWYHLNLVNRFSFERRANPVEQREWGSVAAPLMEAPSRGCVLGSDWTTALCSDLLKARADSCVYYCLLPNLNT